MKTNMTILLFYEILATIRKRSVHHDKVAPY